MGWLKGLEVAASGLSAQRVRMEVVAENLANADVTRTPEGGPYRRKEVVLAARGAYPGIYLPPMVKYAVMQVGSGEPARVMVAGIAEDPSPPKLVYEPGHPDADANGYVRMPNVDVPMEMVDLLSAARAYEANATALRTLRESVQRALELLA